MRRLPPAHCGRRLLAASRVARENVPNLRKRDGKQAARFSEKADHGNRGLAWWERQPPTTKDDAMRSQLVPLVRRSALALTALLLGASAATAQWAAVELGSAANTPSEGAAGAGGAQVGFATVGGVQSAALWTGSSASFINLHPAGFSSSRCYGVDGGVQGGAVTLGSNTFAGIWSGTAGSWTSLHPAGHSDSVIFDVSGTSRVGMVFAIGSFNPRAALWSGSSSAFIDLNPAGSTFSAAQACAPGMQVGSAFMAGGQRASLWTGSAASWVDLTPAGGGNSIAWGTDGVQQVGRTSVSFSDHASLWSGSAASYVDLTPAGATSAEAFDVDAGRQVGYVTQPFASPRAALWSGSAASYVDLHAALPPAFFTSKANSIWQANGRTYVLGIATGPSGTSAMLWYSLAFTTYCTAKTNSVGCAPTIAGLGSASATSSTPFFVRGLNLRNQSNGLLIYGSTGRAALPFANGTLCVEAPRLRSPALNSSGNNPPAADCSGFLLFDMHAFRAGALGGSPAAFLSIPGTLVNCQYWARDAGFTPPNNVQLSNALEYEIGP